MRSLATLALAVTLAGCGSSSNDPRQMAHEFALDAIGCTASADCCAVFDGCRGQALLVAAADRAAVEVLLGEAAQTSCVRCVPPAVQVDCVAGRCVANELASDGTATTAPEQATRNHCGAIDLPAGWSVKPAAARGGVGLAPATVLGCGQ